MVRTGVPGAGCAALGVTAPDVASDRRLVTDAGGSAILHESDTSDGGGLGAAGFGTSGKTLAFIHLTTTVGSGSPGLTKGDNNALISLWYRIWWHRPLQTS